MYIKYILKERKNYINSYYSVYFLEVLPFYQYMYFLNGKWNSFWESFHKRFEFKTTVLQRHSVKNPFAVYESTFLRGKVE